jgi:hypothetical protein
MTLRHPRPRQPLTALLGALAIGGLCALATPARADITVQVAPPPAKMEAKPASPGAGHVWAPGFWERSNDQWVWVSGSWVKAHPKHKHYRQATWVKTKRGYVFQQGGYAASPGGKIVVVNSHPRRKAGHRAKARAHDRRSDKLERQSGRMDAKADRLNNRAQKLDAQGRTRKANKLERKADRLEERADRRDKKAKRQKNKANKQRAKAGRR